MSTQAQQRLLLRLRRIEGQARGVQRMVEDGRECAEILHQLASMRAATQSASLFVLKHYVRECSVATLGDRDKAKPLEDMIELMLHAA